MLYYDDIVCRATKLRLRSVILLCAHHVYFMCCRSTVIAALSIINNIVQWDK